MLQIMRILIITTLMCLLQIESRTVKSSGKFNVNQVIMNDDTMMDDEQKEFKKCDELSKIMLNDILGAAFNSRCE